MGRGSRFAKPTEWVHTLQPELIAGNYRPFSTPLLETLKHLDPKQVNVVGSQMQFRFRGRQPAWVTFPRGLGWPHAAGLRTRVRQRAFRSHFTARVWFLIWKAPARTESGLVNTA